MSRRSKQRLYQIDTYEDGNTVRRLEAVPDYHDERKKRKEERRISEQKRRRRRAARRNRERALKMNAGYVAFLSACVLSVVITSVAYVSLQSDLIIRQRAVESLEAEISSLKLENDAAYKRITSSIDLKEVKKKAKKLGMKYPSENQIVYYSIENADYMTQYTE
ncbi:MAG: hypothetical protein HFH32_06935 [Eubacterium sp.]|jgi:cell division protein FtsL|nr:hypothetical protein [Eubacterium sp.]